MTADDRRLWFGGDYNPEQWPPETLAEDDRLMREAGVTTVTVGVFSWALLGLEEGRYDFGWLDATLDRLAGRGIQVILATPTASPPPWFSRLHPDALPVTADGRRLWHGSRDTYCAAAPAYRAAARRIAAALAARYSGHPALAAWHVHNEYGTICWCEHAAGAFRRWLQHRYGDGQPGLDALNDAWVTAFWSQHYSSWQDVTVPRATQWRHNPSQLLDFRRFWSDELLAAFCEQRDVIRAAGSAAPVTTNFMLPDSYLVADPWTWSREVDVVSVDHYLSTISPDGHADIAFAADRARSWRKGSPWLLMEQATRLVYDGGKVRSRPPGRMLRDSLGYVARGSDSVLFFQWRASRGGAEMLHGAMVPHAGPDSAAFREVSELGQAVSRLAEVTGSAVPAAQAAVLLDTDSVWALDDATAWHAGRLHHLSEVRRDHAALWRAGVVADVATPDSDLSQYRLVLAPALYVLSAWDAASLRHYVESGGTLVVSFGSGIVDEHCHAWTGGWPGGLTEVLGIAVEEWYPLADGEQVTLSGGASARSWTELVNVRGAQVLARYDSGDLAGHAAVTRNELGGGTAWYLSTRLDDTAHRNLITDALTRASVRPAAAGLPAGVEVVRRRAPHGRSWLFVLNHSNEAAELPACGHELLGDTDISGRLRVAAGGVAVVREREPPP